MVYLKNYLILFGPRLTGLTGGYLLAVFVIRLPISYLCFHLAAANASALLVLPAASNASIAAP
jgi:hypothetical protein